jgi:hypothetical protein
MNTKNEVVHRIEQLDTIHSIPQDIRRLEMNKLEEIEAKKHVKFWRSLAVSPLTGDRSARGPNSTDCGSARHGPSPKDAEKYIKAAGIMEGADD